MTSYIFRRLLLIVPTLFGIMAINFVIIQAAPGGPVEQMIAKLRGMDVSSTARVSGQTSEISNFGKSSRANQTKRASQGLDPEFLDRINKLYGFDKPMGERFVMMLKNYATFDFGDSYFRDRRVIDLVIEKMPVSISLGLWTTLLVYFISIPLGIAKAVRDGSKFDVASSSVVIIGNAIPGFLFAILLIVVFAGGRYFQWFPLRGLTSDNFSDLSSLGQIKDYFWHLTLPIGSMVIGGFAGLTMLTKNSYLEEINKQYVTTAKAKGLSSNRVMYGHIFRNAMLIVIAGFPGAFIGILFTGALLTEIIFSLDGLGLLGFEAAIKRDYPVMFGTLYVFTLLGLVMGLVGDLMYHIIDPRIDFEKVDR